MAHWRGEHEEANALGAEALELVESVDDHQIRQALPLILLDKATWDGDLERVIADGLAQTGKSWTDAQGTFRQWLLAIAFCKDLDRLEVWIETMQLHLPRYEDEIRTVEALRGQAAGDDSAGEVEALIREAEDDGWLKNTTMYRTIAAAFLPEDKAAVHLERVRATCTERGWHGYLELVDRYLS